MTALQLILHRAHPALREISGFTTSPLEIEFEVARQYGYTPDATLEIDPAKNWFCLPRKTRAAMLVAMRLQRLEDVIGEYDAAERSKARASARQ